MVNSNSLNYTFEPLEFGGEVEDLVFDHDLKEAMIGLVFNFCLKLPRKFTSPVFEQRTHTPFRNHAQVSQAYHTFIF